MMKAAADAASKAATALDRPRPLVIAVTVLTSMTDADLNAIGIARPMIDQVVHLAKLAQDAGLDGVVASPQEARAIRKACGPDFQIVTPGISSRGATCSSSFVSKTSKGVRFSRAHSVTPARS